MRYYGKVGYTQTAETRPGVWGEEEFVERPYRGDVLKINRRYQMVDQTNDNLNISHQISILADPYALQHFSDIKYVYWNGAKWKVSTVEVDYPRLKLTVGGVYKEND